MTRRGISLVEMLVAVTVGGMLLSLAVRLDLSLARLARGQMERAGAAANLRVLAALARSELEMIGADSVSGPDLQAVAAGRIGYRAHRGLLVVCAVRTDSITIAAGSLADWRVRLPDPGRDSVLVLSSAPLPAAEAWVPVGLAGGGAAVCPDGTPGLSYGTVLDSTALAGFGLAAPTVARLFEAGALAAYGSGGTWQVGFEAVSAGAAIQPVVGPIDGVAGFRAGAWDRSGAPAAWPAEVAGVDIRIRTLARREIAVGPGLAPVAAESLLVAVRFGGRP